MNQGGIKMNCQGCSNRFLYCHSFCDDYIDAKKERERLNKIRREENIWCESSERRKYIEKSKKRSKHLIMNVGNN